MFRNLVIGAFGAGVAVGLFIAIVQQVTTTPLIVAAEVFEDAGGDDHAAAAAVAASDARLVPIQLTAGEDGAEAAEWAPADGAGRLVYTALATMLIAVACGLMLLALMAIRGTAINGRSGLAWGVAGFAAVSLAPAFGLPPELPGSAAAELLQRQIWWAATAIVTAGGIALIAFSANWGARVLAVLLIAGPHVVGAPHPAEFTSTAPAELAGQFAAVTLGLAALFWTLLGWSAGSLYERLERRQAVLE